MRRHLHTSPAHRRIKRTTRPKERMTHTRGTILGYPQSKTRGRSAWKKTQTNWIICSLVRYLGEKKRYLGNYLHFLQMQHYLIRKCCPHLFHQRKGCIFGPNAERKQQRYITWWVPLSSSAKIIQETQWVQFIIIIQNYIHHNHHPMHQNHHHHHPMHHNQHHHHHRVHPCIKESSKASMASTDKPFDGISFTNHGDKKVSKVAI